MSIFHVLYQSYLQAEEKGQVDNFELDETHSNIVILPIFHHNKRSNGNDILEIVLDAEGRADHVNLIPEDTYTIFPITEESLNRTSGARSHPICDDMQYLSKSLNPKKYENYCHSNEIWTDAMVKGLGSHPGNAHRELIDFITDIYKLTRDFDLLEVCRELLQKSYTCEETDEYKLRIEISSGNDEKKAKYKTLDLSKVFVTFRKHFTAGDKRDLEISSNKALHEAHIKYIQEIQSHNEEAISVCDISGLTTYCTNTCRGIMGTSKIISVSNNTETYRGRLRKKEDVYRIGAETSEKIFLMLKFFLEHKENSQYLYDNTTAVIWFANDLLNERRFDLSQPGILEDDLFSFINEGTESDEGAEDEGYVTSSLSNAATLYWKKVLIGQQAMSRADEEDFFYMVIINKTSNGRMAIQAAKTIPLTVFVDNLKHWSNSCFWPRWNVQTQEYKNETPRTWDIINMVYGLEEDGKVVLRNEKLKSMSFRRLLPSILEGRPLPPDLARQMFINFTNRASYPKTWARVTNMTCALVNKRREDQGLERRSSMLEKDEQTRDYLYGRLLAICEKIEIDAMTVKGKKDNDKGSGSLRVTNVEKLWSAFFQAPGKTFRILDQKMQPYFLKLKSDKPGLYVNYQKLLGEVITKIREDADYEAKKNLALGEDAVFGYYAQKQDFYTKKVSEEEK